MSNLTKNGLLCLIIGAIIGLLGNISLFLTGGKIIAISYIGSIGGLFFFIGVILMIIGRKEFGERHSRFVLFALILFIISILVTSIFVGMMVYYSILFFKLN